MSKKRPTIAEDAPISEEEKTMMGVLRKSYGDKIGTYHELHIIRFIRGWMVQDPTMPEYKTTIEKFAEMINWRIEKKVDTIAVAELPKTDLFRQLYPSGVHGFSKDGHPVYIERPCLASASDLLKNFTVDEMKTFCIKRMEALNQYKVELSDKAGRRIYKHVCIIDLEGCGAKHLSSDFYGPIKETFAVVQNYYNESLLAMVIINAPFLFKFFWAIAGLWVDSETKAKILVGKEHMRKLIDKHVIPRDFGGSCKCTKCLIDPFVAGEPEAPAK